MGHNDHIDFELYDRIHHFIDEGHFEEGSKEYGIALFVADNGVDALSEKQRVVWDRGIWPIISKPMNDEERMREAMEKDWEDQMNEPPEPEDPKESK